MAIEVSKIPHIWQCPIELPQNPLRSLNCYVVESQGEALVIDTGFNRPECRNALWKELESLRLDFSKTALFLTHLHSDHIGLVQDFVDRGCRVYMNEIDYRYFCNTKKGGTLTRMESLFLSEGFPPQEVERQATENQGRLYAPEKIFPAVLVSGGYRLRVGTAELECIHTPGHTPGHTALYMPEYKIFFSSDHVLFDITPNISVWDGVPSSLADYLSSLRQVREMEIRMTLPAHRTVHKEVYQRIDEIVRHHHERLEEVWRAIKEAPGANAYRIASMITWSSRNRTWGEFSVHQKWFAVGETLAHLRWLEQAGYILRQQEGQCFTYRILDGFRGEIE